MTSQVPDNPSQNDGASPPSSFGARMAEQELRLLSALVLLLGLGLFLALPFVLSIGSVVFLIPFSVVMLYVSFPAVRNSVSVMEVSPDPGGLPRWPIKIVILISFVLLTLQGFSQIVTGNRSDTQ